jgi:hypothetical protein
VFEINKREAVSTFPKLCIVGSIRGSERTFTRLPTIEMKESLDFSKIVLNSGNFILLRLVKLWQRRS